MLSSQIAARRDRVAAEAGRRPPREMRTLFGDLCELCALFGFAVAQPIYGRLLDRPMYLDRQLDSSLWLLIGLLSVAAPALLGGVSAGLHRLSPRIYRYWFRVVWVSLATAFVLLTAACTTTFIPYPIITAATIGFAGVLAAVRRTFPSLGLMLRLSSAGTVLFPAIFAIEAFGSRSVPLAADAAVPIRRPAPVVMVVLDELCGVALMDGKRRINAVRFPGFAELASESTWYRNATSVHPRTDRAVPAILTGRFPPVDYVDPLACNYPQNLFSVLLNDSIYTPVVMEPYTRLYPPDLLDRFPDSTRRQDTTLEMLQTLALAYLQDLLPRDLPLVSIRMPLAWFDLRDSEGEWAKRSGLIRHPWDSNRSRQVDQFQDCIVARERPTLYFAHFCLPHFPWCYLPSGRRSSPDAGLLQLGPTRGAKGGLKEEWGPDQLAADQACAAYILQTQYLDRQISRLIAKLKAVGLFDECLLVVVADHGVSFRPNHSRRIAAADSLADIMSVPLFVKLPRQKTGEISDRNVETIDVFPTIADVLGIDLPQPVDGISFRDPSAPEKPVKRFFNDGTLFEVDPVFEEKYSVLAYLTGRFGNENSPDRLYRLGPHSELIGRPVEELRNRVHPEWTASLDYPQSLVANDEFVPVHLTGHVEGSGKPSRTLLLAVAVNGVIRGTTQTYAQLEFRTDWSILLPEADFLSGPNRVEVLVLADDPALLATP
jgi:hypothetical protein